MYNVSKVIKKDIRRTTEDIVSNAERLRTAVNNDLTYSGEFNAIKSYHTLLLSYIRLLESYYERLKK